MPDLDQIIFVIYKLLSSGGFMINAIHTFLQKLNSAQHVDEKAELSLEVACTVLLCEVMKADGILQETERAALKTFIHEQFCIDESEINHVIQLALETSDNATDYYQFTKQINEHFNISQRIEIIGYLWKLAYADGELATLEEHIIRKISDLLHLRHSEYIQTKRANTPSL